MTVGGGLRINRAQQVQVTNNSGRTKVEDLVDSLADGIIRNVTGAERVDVEAHWASATDSVGDLNLEAVSQTRGHGILRNPTGGISAGAVHL